MIEPRPERTLRTVTASVRAMVPTPRKLESLSMGMELEARVVRPPSSSPLNVKLPRCRREARRA
jgi:hypothetical protein